jgi:hypothetical protein
VKGYKNMEENENIEQSTKPVEEQEKKQELRQVDQLDKEQLPAFKYDENKSIDQNANDLSELVANKVALEDEKFLEDVAETKKEAIKESAKVNRDIHLTKKEAEKIEALTKVDTAFYEQWKPILEWAGLKHPCKKNLEIFILWLALPFYTLVTIGVTLPLSIIKTLFGAINGLLEEIKTFGKIARSIAFTLLILGSLTAIAFIILGILNKYGLINVF